MCTPVYVRRPYDGTKTVKTGLWRMEEQAEGQSCILVAEDDPDVRSFTGSVLRTAGFSVLEAGDGSDALRQAAHRLPKIALLLSDVCMPGLTGVELARRLTGSRPEMKVVLMSGTDSGSSAAEYGWEFIRKPFSAPALLRIVRRSLAGIGD